MAYLMPKHSIYNNNGSIYPIAGSDNEIYNIPKGARGAIVIVAGIGHGETSSNPGLIAFHIALISLGKV